MERRDIFRRVLESPNIYSFFQNLVGAKRARRIIINDALRPSPGMRVLDVGCGPADILDSLPDLDYVGIDYSKDYIERARHKHGARGLFLVSDVADLAKHGQTQFDLAFAIGVLHHLDDSTAVGLMRDVRACLKSEGRFVTLDPLIERPQNPIARLLARSDRGQYVRTTEQYVQLAKPAFESCSIEVRRDLLHIPYSHAVLRCQA